MAAGIERSPHEIRVISPLTATHSMTESRVREWLRDHQASAHCARCIARDLLLDVGLARAAMDELATRKVFSRGPCACGVSGLCYGWAVGPTVADQSADPATFLRQPARQLA